MTPGADSHLTTADFEARYQADLDPWSYTSSDYERAKYAATLSACGAGPFDRALELGASIGVFTALLAPRCRELITVDAAATAVKDARRRNRDQPHVDIRLGEIPDAIPADGAFDLVVASEILYYLQPAALTGTLARVAAQTQPGARVVAVHWRPAGPERPFTAEQVHGRLREMPQFTPVATAHTDDYLLDVLEATSTS